MKNIKILIFLLVGVFACKAQIVDLNGKTRDYSNGAYFKDLSNQIDPFVGTGD